MKSIDLAIPPGQMRPVGPPANDVARSRQAPEDSPSCRPRSRSSRHRRRRSAARSGSPSSCCSARRWPGPGGARSTSWRRRPARSCRAAAPRWSSRSKPGVVRAIHVQDGQQVKAGDVLIELDPTANAADRDHLRSDLLGGVVHGPPPPPAVAPRRRPLGRFPPPLTPTPPWSPCSARSW